MAFDDMQNNMSDVTEDMRARYEQLKSREQSGELDDSGREELNQLRSRMEGMSQTE